MPNLVIILLLLGITLTECLKKDIYYDASLYPNLITNPKSCYNPQGDDYQSPHLCDPDGILKDYNYKRVNNDLKNFSNETECICDKCKDGDTGIKAYLALAKNIYRPHQAHDEKVLMDMTDQLRTSWSLGECGDDLLIFLVVNDRMMYTSVGFTAKKYIESDYSSTIDKRATQGQDSYSLIVDVIKHYKDRVKKVQADMKKKPEEPADNTGLIVGGVVGGIVGLILLIILLVAFIKSGKMGKTNFRNNRPKTDPEVKIRPAGSVNYSAVGKDDGNAPTVDTKIDIEDRDDSNKKEVDEKKDSGTEKETEKKDDEPEKEKKDSPKTQAKKDSPKTQAKKDSPKTQEKRDSPKTQAKEDSPKVHGKKDSPKTAPPVASKPKSNTPPPPVAPKPKSSTPPPPVPTSSPPDDSEV